MLWVFMKRRRGDDEEDVEKTKKGGDLKKAKSAATG